MRTRDPGKRGQALILVLWTLLVLSMAVFGVVEIVELSIEHTSYADRSLQARGLAMSGLALGLNPQLLRDDPLLTQQSPDGSTFKVTIASDGARMNLNYVLLSKHKEILVNLFTKWGLNVQQADHVSDCLYDWITPGDQKSLNGAKAQDYVNAGLTQTPTYKPFDTFEEVRLVMGIDLLDKVKPNWQDSFTLYSNGPLNVNEAPPDLIAAIFSLDPQRVAFFTNARNGRDGIVGTYDDVKVTSASTFASQLGIGTQTMKELGNQISMGDPHRRIESVGQSQGTQVTIDVVTRLNTSPIEYFLWSEQ